MSSTVNNHTINRIKRVTDAIEEGVKTVTPGDWRISHGHVYGSRPRLNAKSVYDVEDFDICSQPSERQHTVYGVHPNGYKHGYSDMRHITNCKPTTMTKLVADVRELLTEREDPRALVVNLINALADDESHPAFKLSKALEAYQSATAIEKAP